MGNCVANQQALACPSNQFKNSKKLNALSSEFVYNPTQIFDNPQRQHLSSNFLQTKIAASNHLLQDRPLKTVKMVKFSSICSDLAIDDDDMMKICQTMLTKHHRLPSVKISLGDFISTSKKKFQDQYKIIKKIGAGSFGQVFLAQNITTGDIRAIKAIRKSLFHKHAEQIQILKSCDHPNIVQIFQVFQQKLFCYVVMQYCHGGSIIQLIKQKKYFYHEGEAKTIIQQILQALIYLHQKNIVHRDIKLQNVVFMQPNPGQNYTSNLKIIDFGNAEKIKFKVNKVSKLGGTTIYMPPQAFSGWFSQTFDIWSCGVLLYILLCGSSPFRGKNKQQTINLIKNKQITFSQHSWKKVSTQVKDLISMMLNKDFLKRPSAYQCLENIWFSSPVNRSLIRKASQKLTKNLSKYYAINNFVSIIESYLSFIKMSQSQKNEIKELFQAIDSNHKGFLSKEDIQKGTKFTKYKLDQQILEQLFLAIDKNKSGYIDYSQFQTAMSNREKLFIKQSLKTAFDHFDIDGSGYIEKMELFACLKDNQIDVQQLISQIDKDRDQKISKSQFLEYFQFIQKKIQLAKQINQ